MFITEHIEIEYVKQSYVQKNIQPLVLTFLSEVLNVLFQ